MKTLFGALGVVVVLSGCAPSAEPAEEVSDSDQELTLGGPQLPLVPRPVGPITLTTLAPLVGPTGTVVTVNGTNLQQQLRQIYRFSNDPLTSPSLPATILSGTQVRVTVPAGSLGGQLCVHSIVTNARSACTTSSFTVGDPDGRIRMTNNSQASIISARFNNAEWLAPTVINPGGWGELYPVTVGQYSYRLSIGFGPFAGPAAGREICALTSNGALTVPANTTTNITAPPLNIAQLLGHCGTVDYSSTYLDDNAQLRTVTLRFFNAGTWQFREGNTVLGSGNVSTISYPANSAFVTFQLAGAGWANVTIGFPYDTFVAGPSGDTLIFERAAAW
jgi:hypothetical protein